MGIRLTSALIGIATIPLAFLLFREMFSRRMGLIAAALTASRNGYPNILIPPLECLALYFLWRGYRDGRKELMALSWPSSSPWASSSPCGTGGGPPPTGRWARSSWTNWNEALPLPLGPTKVGRPTGVTAAIWLLGRLLV